METVHCFHSPIDIYINSDFKKKYNKQYVRSVMRMSHMNIEYIKWAASSEFGTYRLCEQRRFRRACASAQSRQNLRCSLIQAVSRGTFRQKARSLATLNGWTCAVKICHDGMLEDTNSLDGAQIIQNEIILASQLQTACENPSRL